MLSKKNCQIAKLVRVDVQQGKYDKESLVASGLILLLATWVLIKYDNPLYNVIVVTKKNCQRKICQGKTCQCPLSRKLARVEGAYTVISEENVVVDMLNYIGLIFLFTY